MASVGTVDCTSDSRGYLVVESIDSQPSITARELGQAHRGAHHDECRGLVNTHAGYDNGQDVVDVKATVRAICKAKTVEYTILEKLSNNAGLNLSAELGQLKGLSEASSEMVGK